MQPLLVEKVQFSQQLLELEDEWESLLEKSTKPSIYGSLDFIYTFLKHLYKKPGEANDVFFILMRDSEDRQLRAIFPMSLWKEKKYNKIVSTLSHGITIDNTDVDKPYPVIHRDYEAESWSMLKYYFENEYTQWDRLLYDELIKESCLNQLSKKLFSLPRYFVRETPGALSPIVNLSGNWPDFEAKHRNLRKKAKRIEKKLTNGYAYKIYHKVEDMQACLEKYIKTELSSWKANMGVSDKKFSGIYAELLLKLARKNRVYFGVLYDGNDVVSIEMSYVYLNTVYFAHGTYNPAYRNLSPGSVSTSKFIEFFHGKNYIDGDFLAGYAFYISSWAERMESTKNIEVFKVNKFFFYCAFFSLLIKIKKKLIKYKKKLTGKKENEPGS